MNISSIRWAFIVLLSLSSFCVGAPIHNHDVLLVGTSTFTSNVAIILSVSVLLLCIIILFGCTCCPHKDGQAIANSSQCPIRHLNQNNILQLQRPSEFAIFPPCSSVISLQPVHSGGFGNEAEKVVFEPLPDILPKRHVNGQNLAQSSKPAHFSALLKKKNSLHDWFDDPSSNFPRNQLQYLREMGNGWFGRVVEGEAQKITAGQEKTPVMVKILREEASPSEHLYFLHEVRPYRNLQHVNILRLLGRCLETDPFLLIMEHTVMDLKSYLIRHHDTFMKKDNLRNEQLLQWALDITSGLMHMHEHGFTHTDLAAHNCFLTLENSIKIGDYGLSFDVFREDYYCLGDIALPIRWYSPETLLCSETTIEAKDATKEANIWSLAVVFWELLEFGKLPYADMNNEEVLQNVIIERVVQLKAPQLCNPHKEQMFQVMQLCWNPPLLRPKIQEIEMLLRQIYEHKDFFKSFSSFEERWNALQAESNSVAHDVVLRFENDFVPNGDNRSASIFSTDGNVSESSAFELSGSEVMQRNFDSYLSASLRGLNGSFDEIGNNDFEPANVPLSASENASAHEKFSNSHSTFEDTSDSLHNLEVVTPEEISEAIRDFDAMLATEARLLGVDSRSTTLERPKDKYKPLNREENVLIESLIKLQKLNDYDKEHAEETVESIEINQLINRPCQNLTAEDDVIYERTISQCSLDLDLDNLEDDNVTPLVSPENDIQRCAFDSKSVEESFSASNKEFLENTVDEIQPSDINQTVVAPSTLKSEEIDFLQCNKQADDITSKSENRLLPIPDIVIDPSMSCQETDNDSSSEEQVINNEIPVVDAAKPKLRNFRFVLKEESLANEKLSSGDNLFDLSGDNVPDSGKNSQEHLEKDTEPSGPLTSTPTKNIVFFNDDKFFPQSSEDLCPDISFISFKTSTTNSECYESAIDTITSEVALNSSDYETAASTFNVANESIFNFTNESMTDANAIENESATNTVFRYSHTFINDVTSNSGVTETSSFLYVDAKNDTEVQSSHFTTAQQHNKALETSDLSPDILFDNIPQETSENSILGVIVKTDCDIDASISNEAEIVPRMQSTVLPEVEEKSEAIVFNGSTASSTFQLPDTSIERQDDSQQNDSCISQDWSSQTPTDSKEFAIVELMNEGDETGISDTVSDSFAFKKQCEWSIVDDMSTEALTFSDGLTQSISDTISESFTYDKPIASENIIDESGAKSEQSESFLFIKPSLVNNPMEGSSDISSSNLTNNDHNIDKGVNSTTFTTNCHSDGQEEITIEDLETEESTSYVISDNYEEEQLDEDDVLKIDVETNEAILVDSSQSLIGFVPSRSIEMLQECNDIASHYDAPISNSLTVEDTESSSTSPASYSSKNVHLDISNQCNGNIVKHLDDSPESSPATIISSSEGLISDQENLDDDHKLTNAVADTLELNNNIVCDSSSPDPYNDLILSSQPTKSVVWHSDETLDVIDDNDPNGNARSVIIESREIMAGSNFSMEITLDDSKSGLDSDQFGSSDFLDRLAVSPSSSPHDSVASTPCRDVVYTPDFENESEDSSSSCSSTSGSFECLHNKFKNIGNISLASETVNETHPPLSENDSKEPSPMKIFSTTWDCHATPNKGLLKTPEKKVLPMRKSVSFHDEPQHVFQYPPASDSSEEECVEDANEFSWHVDYTSYTDWDLQVSEEDDIPEEMIEIEELDSEPYNRSLYRGSRPLTGPAMYTITGFSDDEDLDLSETKSSSQFSAFSDFRLTSERESPVRVSATSQGLSLIKEGPDGEEEFTIEEVFTDADKNEKSPTDNTVNIHIAFPDNEPRENKSYASSAVTNVHLENDNIPKAHNGTDMPVLMEEDSPDENVENSYVLELDVVSVGKQSLVNHLLVCDESAKFETDIKSIPVTKAATNDSPIKNIVSKETAATFESNSCMDIVEEVDKHEVINFKSEEILENIEGVLEDKTKKDEDLPESKIADLDSNTAVTTNVSSILGTESANDSSTEKTILKAPATYESNSTYIVEEMKKGELINFDSGKNFENIEGVLTDTAKEIKDLPESKSSNLNSSNASSAISNIPEVDLFSNFPSSALNTENNFLNKNRLITDMSSIHITESSNNNSATEKTIPKTYATYESNSDMSIVEDIHKSQWINFKSEKILENAEVPADNAKEKDNFLENKSTDANSMPSVISHAPEYDLLSDFLSPMLDDAENNFQDKDIMLITTSQQSDEKTCKDHVNKEVMEEFYQSGSTEVNNEFVITCERTTTENIQKDSNDMEIDAGKYSTRVLESDSNRKDGGVGQAELKSKETAALASSDNPSAENGVSPIIPSIVVTNVEENLVHEELEEFLSGHFKFYASETEKTKELSKDDFMVTSNFSETPFEDPFGYCNGTSMDCDEDFNFVEAINRHCSAQTFSDLLNLSEGVNISLQNGCILDPSLIDSDEVRSERSTSLPIMIDEKAIKADKSLGFSSL